MMAHCSSATSPRCSLVRSYVLPFALLTCLLAIVLSLYGQDTCVPGSIPDVPATNDSTVFLRFFIMLTKVVNAAPVNVPALLFNGFLSSNEDHTPVCKLTWIVTVDKPKYAPAFNACPEAVPCLKVNVAI